MLVRLVDRAALHQASNVAGRRDLARERPRFVDARLERVARSAERVDRQGRRDIGGARKLLGSGERQRQDRRGRLGAVDQGKAFLRPERDWLQSGLPERFAS